MQSVPQIPPRSPHTHKGDYGHVLLIGGRRGMTGAISIAGQACLRSGAGLTTVAVPDRCLELVAAMHVCYMTMPLPCEPEGAFHEDSIAALESIRDRFQVVAIGPGLGRGVSACRLATWLYETWEQPMVIDADALYALGTRWGGNLPKAAGPRILTPHQGELRRLLGVDDQDREKLCLLAQRFAAEHHVVMVLKGAETMIADAERTVYNSTGNPGMASGGSGDCLTGVIAALLAQHLSPFEAAQLGVYIHGFAGDIAFRQLGGPSILATDIIACLPEAFSRNSKVIEHA